jgi:hypothetical protein
LCVRHHRARGSAVLRSQVLVVDGGMTRACPLSTAQVARPLRSLARSVALRCVPAKGCRSITSQCGIDCTVAPSPSSLESRPSSVHALARNPAARSATWLMDAEFWRVHEMSRSGCRAPPQHARTAVDPAVPGLPRRRGATGSVRPLGRRSVGSSPLSAHTDQSSGPSAASS